MASVMMSSPLCGISVWGASRGYAWHPCTRDATLTAQCDDSGRAARTNHPCRCRGGLGGYLVLADTQAQAEAWAHDCLWFWDTWSLLFGQGHPPLLSGDADTVSRMIEEASRHVPFNEVFLLFGQGLLERDKCLKTLELFAEKVMPRFQD
jgi:hypothetical protein